VWENRRSSEQGVLRLQLQLIPETVATHAWHWAQEQQEQQQQEDQQREEQQEGQALRQ